MLRTLFLLTVLAFGCQSFDPIGPAIGLALRWKDGEAIKYYANDKSAVLDALRLSLRELDLGIVSEETDGLSTTIRIGTLRTTRMKIVVKQTNSKVTRVGIRVNTFGDKPYAELICRTADSHLKAD